LIEARNLSLIREEASPEKLPWMQVLDDALLSDDVEHLKALRVALWNAAQGGDGLALALLPRLLSISPELRDDQTTQWLVKQAQTNKSVDPGSVAAIAALMDEGAVRTDLLRRAAPSSAVAAETLAHEGEEKWAAVAADKWQVDAQFSQGARGYSDEKASDEEKRRAWRHLTRAASRGHAGAQYLVGAFMRDNGDYAGAVLWLGKAAASGAPRFENDFAWLLATCEVTSIRDPAKALSLSMEAVRRSQPSGGATDSHRLEDIPIEEALDTLAAAYAASGDFAGAVDTQTNALALMRRSKNRGAIASAESRLAAYKAQIAWIEH